MQLTPDEKQLFEQLGRNPYWLGWLAKLEQSQIKVLKVNPNPVQLAQAQGQAQLIDAMKAISGVQPQG